MADFEEFQRHISAGKHAALVRFGLAQTIFDLAVIYGPRERDREVFGDHWFSLLEVMHEKFLEGRMMPKSGSDSAALLCAISGAAEGKPVNHDPMREKRNAFLELLEQVDRENQSSPAATPPAVAEAAG